MQDSFDRSPQDDSNSIYRSCSIKLIALPVLAVVALIAYAVSHPETSYRVSEAVLTEFLGTAPKPVPPSLAGQPTNQIRTVH